MTHSARRDVQLDPELFDGFVEGDLDVSGSLTAGNIKWGQALVPTSGSVNKPVSVTVTGLDLKGTGRVEVILTPASTVPQNVKAVSSQEETPDGFQVWAYRSTAANTAVNWLALRQV